MEGRWQVEMYTNKNNDIHEQECFDTQTDALWYAARLMLLNRHKFKDILIEIQDNEHEVSTSLLHIHSIS